MQIYLAKPGGQREGPYTLEQINRDLAAKKYSDSDYWAWHEGMPKWLPLHSLPGVSAAGAVPPPPAAAPPPARAVATAAPPPKASVETPAAVPPAKQITDVHKPEAEAPKKVEPVKPAPEVHQREIEPAKKPEPVIAQVAKIETEKPTPVRSEPARPIEVQAIAQPAVREPEPIKPSPQVEPIKHSPQPEPEVIVRRVDVKPEAAPAPRLAGTPDESVIPPAIDRQPDSAAPAAAAPDAKSSTRLPFDALEQVFIFSTGEGRAVFDSPAVLHKLQDSAGEPVSAIRGKVKVDIVGHLDLGIEIIEEDFIPDKAWQVMAKVRPTMVEQAKAGEYKVCARPVLSEANDIVTVFLFYNKQRL